MQNLWEQINMKPPGGNQYAALLSTRFQKFQLSSFLRTNMGPDMILPVLSDIESLFYEGSTNRK